jgi:heterodisulfide reductase subunit B
VLKLSGNLIRHAQAVGADIVAVACPLCHTNLDARQFQMELDEPLPILYFTQLMALAMGLPKKAAALHKNLVDPVPVLQAKGIPVSYQ